MFEKKFVILSFASALTCTVMAAQQPMPAPAPAQTATAPAAVTSQEVPDGGMPTYVRPETADQRRARIGTADDPGIDPDPSKQFWRFGHSFHIEKFERRWAAADQPDPMYIRPFAPLNVIKEVYQENEKWVWVWMPDPAPQEEVPETRRASDLTPGQMKYFQDIREEFNPISVPESGKTIRFEESSDGLPVGGSYRNSLAVADMNEDGCPDIITPPQRGGNGAPEIYLGDCKGHWKFWAKQSWPYRLDYGSVVAADFNKDGHMDLAFGVHLNGVYVFLGDGKGNFDDFGGGRIDDFPTRRIAVADVDHDGYPDIVALSEGPAAATKGMVSESSKMRVYLNRDKAKSWQVVNVAPYGDQFGGDWLSVGKFNDDVYPDFVAASVYFNGPAILWLSNGKKQWKNVGAGTTVPTISYYFANATGRFASRKLDDAIVSFTRTWPETIDQRTIPQPANKSISGIDRISFTGKEPQRTPIVRWATSRPIWAMATADLDGDGNLDLIYIRPDPRGIEVLLGDGKGGFQRAGVEGLTLAPNTSYDIKIADVNGDGKPDIILAYETASLTTFSPRDGSIHVFLNRGVVSPPAHAKK